MATIFSRGLPFLLLLGILSCTRELEPVRVQLDWTHEPQFSGFYAGISAGDFKEEGLTLELREGKPGFGGLIDVAQPLLEGEADVGTMGWTLFQTSFQKHPELAVLGASFQISPRVLMIKADKPWQSPKNLEGHSIGVKSASWEALVRRVLTKAGADVSKVKFLTVVPDDIFHWYSDEIDVWTGFSISEPLTAEAAGYPVRLWFADDYGAGAYEQILVADRRRISKNPGFFERIVKAWKKGWTRVVNSPESVPAWDAPWGLDKDKDLLVKTILKIIPLVDPGRNDIGSVDPKRWADLGGDPQALLQDFSP